MRQVLFRLPISTPWTSDVPIYGFGMMLVVALFLCVWVAGRRARKEGVAPEHIQDLAFWAVIAGIIGARVVFMIQYRDQWLQDYQRSGQNLTNLTLFGWAWLYLSEFVKFWKGGLVFYGALAGGTVGFLLAYFLVLRRQGIYLWKLADIIAPTLALGLCLGRVGCLLNGCCYGDVACPNCPGIRFPMGSFAWDTMVRRGYQPAAGFSLDSLSSPAHNLFIVGEVDAESDAARVAGLGPGDVILQVNNKPLQQVSDLFQPELTLTVQRGQEEITLPTYQPRTLPLNPTQVYESISMVLLFLMLMAYSPLRRRDGEVFALFLICYPIHRFLNEVLRNDTDPVALNLTLSQNGSILVVLVALGLWFWLWRRPVQYPTPQAVPAAKPAA